MHLKNAGLANPLTLGNVEWEDILLCLPLIPADLCEELGHVWSLAVAECERDVRELRRVGLPPSDVTPAVTLDTLPMQTKGPSKTLAGKRSLELPLTADGHPVKTAKLSSP